MRMACLILVQLKIETYLDVPVRDEDIVMTLFESSMTSYEYVITALVMMPVKELTMNLFDA